MRVHFRFYVSPTRHVRTGKALIRFLAKIQSRGKISAQIFETHHHLRTTYFEKAENYVVSPLRMDEATAIPITPAMRYMQPGCSALRFQEDPIAVVVEELPLSFTEDADVHMPRVSTPIFCNRSASISIT